MMTMLIHEQSGSVLLNVSDPLQVRDLLPKSRMLPHPDYNIAVQHTLDNVRVLRNLGLDVPAPITSGYAWPGKYRPFDHQRTMAEVLTLHPRVFNLSEMGTGKTASCLWAADWLMKKGFVQRALILSPLSTLERVWKSDIFDILMHRRCVVVHGSLERRMKALNTDVDFYILNHDGVSIDEVANHVRRRPDIDLIIVDEASMFRNHSTSKYKALGKMVRPEVRLWLLTGTPCPNAPTDAWALARLVNPSKVPQFFGSFRRQVMFQESQFKWAAKPEAYNIAYEAMQPAVRFKKKDCLDLPPVTTMDRECSMTKEQRDAFQTMRSEMIAEAKDRAITAVNAADKITKLRQILCGALRDPKTGDYVTLSHKPRTDLLLECIEQASAKVIVVVPFKGIIQSLSDEVSKHYSCAVLNGDVSPGVRNEIIRAFKMGKDPHVLLCHPKVMAHGLNLTEADTLVFYAPIYSNDEFQQVTERFNRAGQTRKMTIVRMASHPIEWKIYGIVDGKKTTQDNILNLYKEVTA
jgi:SNF2 family DNA or RNA helicase